MKRSILAAVLLVAAGTASAQTTFGILNGRGAAAALLAGTPALPGGLGPATPFFLAGNTVEGFANGRNGFIGAVNVLTADTPRLAGLAAANEALFNNGYNALLPVYQAIDPVLMRIAAPGAPITVPVGQLILDGATQIAITLNGNALRLSAINTLPGLGGLSFQR